MCVLPSDVFPVCSACPHASNMWQLTLRSCRCSHKHSLHEDVVSLRCA